MTTENHNKAHSDMKEEYNILNNLAKKRCGITISINRLEKEPVNTIHVDGTKVTESSYPDTILGRKIR
jgi:hypothetical protein